MKHILCIPLFHTQKKQKVKIFFKIRRFRASALMVMCKEMVGIIHENETNTPNDVGNYGDEYACKA